MAALLGLGPAGPVAGGAFAGFQSAAMGGALTPAAAGLVAATASVLPLAVAAAVVAEYMDAQDHGMGPATDNVDTRYVLIVHNWGAIEFRAFENHEAAVRAFQAGGRLRRILVKRNGPDDSDIDNGHGWRLPWQELRHDGFGCLLDDGMRNALLGRIAAVRAVCP